MSSRKDEKAQRREEREALEAQMKAREATRKRMRLVGVGALLVLGLVAAIFAAVSVNGGDDDEPASDVTLPERRERELGAAARLAGCKVSRARDDGSEHTSEQVKYQTNPPTSGDHDPTPAEDGVYSTDNPPDIEQSVHSLEHGRINLQYAANTPPRVVDQLETLHAESFKGQDGYHTLLFRNQSGMKPAIAATAWTQALTCASVNDRTWDALRAFRETYVDKGPEFIP